MPYISIRSKHGHDTYTVTEEFAHTIYEDVLQILGGTNQKDVVGLPDGYGNIVYYPNELLRQSIVTFGGLNR